MDHTPRGQVGACVAHEEGVQAGVAATPGIGVAPAAAAAAVAPEAAAVATTPSPDSAGAVAGAAELAPEARAAGAAGRCGAGLAPRCDAASRVAASPHNARASSASCAPRRRMQRRRR